MTGPGVEQVAAPRTPGALARDPALVRKLVVLYACALALVLVDQWVKYEMVAALTSRFEGLPSLGERLRALYGPAPAPGWDGLHFRPKRPIVFSEDFLMLRYAENPGAAFGLFRRLPPAARGPLFHLVSIGAVVLITLYYLRLSGAKEERWAMVGLPLVLGGAIGNWVDRLARGFVIDFIEAHWKDVYTWPSFNVADSAIVVGVILLLVDGIVRRERKAAPAP
ncbi:MAG TPA: signal peptidase II [Myxococcaceae bacterium]|nr:signal peptidase II [Myxococcaceae bacterium]